VFGVLIADDHPLYPSSFASADSCETSRLAPAPFFFRCTGKPFQKSRAFAGEHYRIAENSPREILSALGLGLKTPEIETVTYAPVRTIK